MDSIQQEENILLAYRNIKSNKGSHTKGTDGRTIQSLASMHPKELVHCIRKKLSNYFPQSIRRVEIPKPDGRKRPLGIPTIGDRMVQQCILQILEPICEAKFFKHSYGFRPLRSAHHAVARAHFLTQVAHLHYVVDIDIKGFFDNIDHGKLLKQLWTLGIRDKSLLKVISKMLKAEIEGIGIPHKGTPQGGILSPLLANVVLNELDWWIASQWERHKTRYPYQPDKRDGSMGHMYEALKKTELKEVNIVRYADDFKLFCRNHNHARRVFSAVQLWLSERLGLEISPAKSRITNLRKSYSDFLGIKFKVRPKGSRSVKGVKKTRYVAKSRLADKAKQRIVDRVRQYVKGLQHSQEDDGPVFVHDYNSYVIGVHSYYSCATMCSMDFSEIAFLSLSIRKNRLSLRS
ncbi:group II intron reverse transcriptase/maturase [Pseudodesulfovibrio profundus]|nr:group II intron reverse transcriptase/maturase [Pseudodesulfovibrio profundus]